MLRGVERVDDACYLRWCFASARPTHMRQGAIRNAQNHDMVLPANGYHARTAQKYLIKSSVRVILRTIL
jgi:hypothetical protein